MQMIMEINKSVNDMSYFFLDWLIKKYIKCNSQRLTIIIYMKK